MGHTSRTTEEGAPRAAPSGPALLVAALIHMASHLQSQPIAWNFGALAFRSSGRSAAEPLCLVDLSLGWDVHLWLGSGLAVQHSLQISLRVLVFVVQEHIVQMGFVGTASDLALEFGIRWQLPDTLGSFLIHSLANFLFLVVLQWLTSAVRALLSEESYVHVAHQLAADGAAHRHPRQVQTDDAFKLCRRRFHYYITGQPIPTAIRSCVVNTTYIMSLQAVTSISRSAGSGGPLLA